MKKRYILFSIGVLLVLAASLLLVHLARRHIHAAALATAGLLCAAALVGLIRWLVLRLAPARIAERYLAHHIQSGDAAYVAHFDESEVPDLLFHGAVRRRDGLRTLVLSSIAPEAALDGVPEGLEVQVSFFDRLGRARLCLEGTLTPIRGQPACQIAVRTVILSGGKRRFSP